LAKRDALQFEIDYRLIYLMTKTDGKISIRQGIDSLNLVPSERESAFALAREGFKALWERGHIYILKPEKILRKAVTSSTATERHLLPGITTWRTRPASR